LGDYADVNGVHLYYEIHGQGRPTMLLHGGLGNGSMFGANLAALARGRKVIAPDRQGHGRTADVDRKLNAENVSGDIIALIEHLKLDQVDIVGYSLGGGAALWTTLKRPDLVRKLVVISTPIRRNAFFADILGQQEQVGPETAEMMKQTPMYQLYASIAPRPQDWGRLLGKIGEGMKDDFDLTKQVATIKTPTMFVAGDADMFPPKHAVEIFELLGGGKKDGGWMGEGRSTARLAILPGVTHYAMGAAPSLMEVVIPFLDEA